MSKQIEQKIAEEVVKCGGRCYYVGGYVRDEILGIPSLDKDVEIYGVDRLTLENIFKKYKNADFSKSKYGVYSLCGVDFALPRTEVKTGEKHGDFEINVDPFMDFGMASSRRDFTVNAIFKDVITGEIIDKVDGRTDLKKRVLKAVNLERFCEDGLRVLRGAGFVARYNFNIENKTLNLFKKANVCSLSGERVYSETAKALLYAKTPSEYFKVLNSCDKLCFWFSELNDLIGIRQNPKYHTEGDAYSHTLLVLDISASFRDKVDKPLEFMLSALSQDFGKSVCTETQSGKFHTKGHELKSAELSETFLRRLHASKSTINYVVNMAKYHMQPNILASRSASVKDTDTFFDKVLFPNDIIYLARADALGSKSVTENPDYSTWLKERLQDYYSTVSVDTVSGKDLINAGVTPNKNFREILEYVKRLVNDGESKKSAIEKAVKKYSSR